jgi:hypothetical protein
MGPVEVRAAIESMKGARFVHDTLERQGWEVEVADAQKVKGLAPLAGKADRIDAWVLAEIRDGGGDLRHRHTVAYRLERVRELTSLDPMRSEDRERLGLGLKAYRIMRRGCRA